VTCSRIIPRQHKGFSKQESLKRNVLLIHHLTARRRTSWRLSVEAAGDVITSRPYTVLGQPRNVPQAPRKPVEGKHVQAPSMTRIVKALTDQGFATWTVHPGDGRQVQAGITPAGKAVFTEAREQRTTRLAQWMARLSEDDRLILRHARHSMQQLSAK